MADSSGCTRRPPRRRAQPQDQGADRLAIGVSVRCDGCIAYHVHHSLEAEASREEVAEAMASRS